MAASSSSKRALPPPAAEEEEEATGGGGSALRSLKRPRLWGLHYSEEGKMELFLDRLCLRLQPIIQQAIQEAVHKSPCNYTCTACRPSRIHEVAKFRLCFQERWQDELLTDGKINVGTKIPFKVVIKDANSNIIASGPLSLIRIKVVVLNADFGGNGREEWTEEEFVSHILSAREGKEALLKGDMENIHLTSGVSRMVNVTFTDNSSWTKSKKFRLGASAESGCTEERVLEAISEAFEVKDCRVTLKGQPLSLNDKVHCLKNIAKNGPYQKKLAGAGINTVQDFLRSLSMDPVGLHNLLGSRMGKEKWKETEKHASGCILDNKLYSYCITELGVVLVFNCIYELIGVTKDDLYHPLEELTTSEKDKVNELKEIAYKNAGDIAEIRDALVSSLLRPPPALVVTPIGGSSSSDPQIPNIPAIFCGVPSEVGLQHPSHASRISELFQEKCSYTRDVFNSVHHQFGSLLNEESSGVFSSNDTLTSLINATTIPGLSSSSGFPDVSAICHAAAPVGFQDPWPEASSQSSFHTCFSPEEQILGCDFTTSEGDSEPWYLWNSPGGETNTACASVLPASSTTTLSLRKWVNLITVLRWRFAFKRKLSASRGARVVHSGHQSVVLCS